MSDEKKMIRYVVQRLVTLTDAAKDGTYVDDAWVDVATVEVEPRTKRSTVIKKALAQADIQPGGEPPKLRALDAESAEVHAPESKTTVEWVIG